MVVGSVETKVVLGGESFLSIFEHFALLGDDADLDVVAVADFDVEDVGVAGHEVGGGERDVFVSAYLVASGTDNLLVSDFEALGARVEIDEGDCVEG